MSKIGRRADRKAQIQHAGQTDFQEYQWRGKVTWIAADAELTDPRRILFTASPCILVSRFGPIVRYLGEKCRLGYLRVFRAKRFKKSSAEPKRRKLEGSGTSTGTPALPAHGSGSARLSGSTQVPHSSKLPSLRSLAE